MDLILLWLLGGLFFLPFGGSFATAETEVAPVPSAAASPVPGNAAVQGQFEEREMLPSCGSLVAGPSGLGSSEVQPGWECLDDSVGGAGGEMVVYSERQDGSPVYTYVRVTPTDLMEIYTQDIADFATPWTYEACAVQAASFRQGCP